MLRFEEALDAWTEKRLTREEAAQLLLVCVSPSTQYARTVPVTMPRYADAT